MNNPAVKKFNLSIILTHQCNLRCYYCYESIKNNQAISIDVAKNIICKYLNSEEYDEVEIDFFGGEPFLEFQKIKEICEWVWSQQWKNNFLFFTTTNGTLVHGKIKEWLRRYKNRFWVSVSLDGERQSHNINRNNSFDFIDISFFYECWPSQTVKMTISKETVNNLYNNITYLHSLGFKITGTNFAEGFDWEDTKFKKVVFEQLEKLCKYYIDNPDIEPVPLINMSIFKCEKEKRKTKICGCGELMAAYEPDGRKYPCTFFTPMTFNKEQLSFVDKIDWSDAENFIDEDCFNSCYLEPVCNCCYGANLLRNGKINIRDKSKCELMKVRAVFSAALAAHKLIQNPVDNYEKSLTAKAIQKINILYNTL
ncbi:MAG: 4Fe-4S cluster-binding domain-containing protein [Prevotellaceae bacterium]|jgi:sulfatase maturation enzyme AslB (radical SAM superfamily)|nr:4Fe-4S cluster-binding domain-containing protein [Prevotellaceae bacterium]